MAFDHEKRAAARLLAALEDGILSPSDTRPLAEEADPALLYLIIAWLRVHYHAGHSASEGVLGRIVALCRYDTVARRVRAGEKDFIVGWFQDTYDYSELDRVEFIALVVEKLEG